MALPFSPGTGTGMPGAAAAPADPAAGPSAAAPAAGSAAGPAAADHAAADHAAADHAAAGHAADSAAADHSAAGHSAAGHSAADPAEQPCRQAEAAARASLALGSGAFAQQLIQHQVRRLGRLQAAVLADRDPEPLHQLRVSLRRLRTVLVQFGPALELPRQATPQRIASVARRTSLCRDLDVLRMRLDQQLLPAIPPEQQRSFAGVIQRLGRDRAEAFQTLVEALHSSRYLRLLQRLNQWQRQPRFTPLGQLPLLPWLADWQAPFSAGLFLHPGWTVVDPAAPQLHGLRKRIKAARYALEILAAWCEPQLQAWLEDLRQAQEHLGELHDLQLLQHNLADGLRRGKRCGWPLLLAEIEAQQLLHWLRWRELAQRLYSDHHRHAIQRQLGQLGRC